MNRVSDIITIDIVRNWTQGNIITITAGTGAGKSYWTKNILYYVAKEHNKKILFLIHRSNCKDQFYEELKKADKLDTITLLTYQSLEAHYIKNNKFMDISHYDYIVCDEFHYFMSDAAFNKTTDISLDTILKHNNSIQIYMSATGNYTKQYLNTYKHIETIDYNIKESHKPITMTYFYYDDNILEYIADKVIKSNRKGIFFIQSAEKAYRLFNKYKDNSIFNCSRHNDKYYKYVDVEQINNVLINEKFDKQILITTTCMDAGVNLIDTDIKFIISDVKDMSILKQCIGRKRIQNKEDNFFLFLKAYNNNTLGGLKTQLYKKIEKAEYFIKHGINKYIDKYYKDHDNYDIVYDINTIEGVNKQLNELMYFKCKIDINIIETMLNYKKIGYIKYICNELNQEGNYKIMDMINKDKNLNSYLESITGVVMLQTKDRKELIEKIDVKSNGKLLRSKESLNSALQEMKLPYMIIELNKITKIENGKKKQYKTPWKVIKIE